MKYFQKPGTDCHQYMLPILNAVLPDPTIPLLFIEGEKKTALAVQYMHMAAGIPGAWSWLTAELDGIAFPDRAVEIVFDSDVWIRPDLQRALFAFGKELEGRGANVSIVVIPGAESQKIGFDDFVVANGIGDFKKLNRITLKNGAMSQHKGWWERWKEKNRKSETDTAKPNKFVLSDPEPWSDPVNGEQLLFDLCKEIQRFIVGTPASYVAQALWLVHAYCLNAFPCSPFLVMTSPVMRSGKTRRLEVTSKLCPRPLWTSNVSPPALFRSVEKFKPTLLIDEADQFLNLSPELKGILNASHYRASAITIRTVGDEHEPTVFRTWCPKAIALIGNLPATLSDRSILLPMTRKKKTDFVERFSPGNNYDDLEQLRSKCARWAADHLDNLKTSDPNMPKELNDRLQDNWRPLLAIADLVGGRWPRWARLAALALNDFQDDSIGVELLRDISIILEGTDKISSETLVEQLNDLATRPWPDWNRQKGLTQRNLAALLRGFGIRPKKIRIADKTVQGYEESQFVKPFDTYLANQDESNPEHTGQGNDFGELDAIFHPEQVNPVPDEKNTATTEKETFVPDVLDDSGPGDKAKPSEWEELSQ